jgi:hypothetical protein
MSIYGCKSTSVVNTVEIFQSDSFFQLIRSVIKDKIIWNVSYVGFNHCPVSKTKLKPNLSGTNPVPDLF